MADNMNGTGGSRLPVDPSRITNQNIEDSRKLKELRFEKTSYHSKPSDAAAFGGDEMLAAAGFGGRTIGLAIPSGDKQGSRVSAPPQTPSDPHVVSPT